MYLAALSTQSGLLHTQNRGIPVGARSAFRTAKYAVLANTPGYIASSVCTSLRLVHRAGSYRIDLA